MLLDEAIERVGELALHYYLKPEPFTEQALRLGVEAMKFRQEWEALQQEDTFILLPGEDSE